MLVKMLTLMRRRRSHTLLHSNPKKSLELKQVTKHCCYCAVVGAATLAGEFASQLSCKGEEIPTLPSFCLELWFFPFENISKVRLSNLDAGLHSAYHALSFTHKASQAYYLWFLHQGREDKL